MKELLSWFALFLIAMIIIATVNVFIHLEIKKETPPPWAMLFALPTYGLGALIAYLIFGGGKNR